MCAAQNTTTLYCNAEAQSPHRSDLLTYSAYADGSACFRGKKEGAAHQKNGPSLGRKRPRRAAAPAGEACMPQVSIWAYSVCAATAGL
jgi:hypothetical protein